MTKSGKKQKSVKASRTTKRKTAKPATKELSDAELEGVAGGAISTSTTSIKFNDRMTSSGDRTYDRG